MTKASTAALLLKLAQKNAKIKDLQEQNEKLHGDRLYANELAQVAIAHYRQKLCDSCKVMEALRGEDCTIVVTGTSQPRAWRHHSITSLDGSKP